MDFDPPSAMTRFGMFFLAGGVALIFAFWGILKYVDHPRKTTAIPSQTPMVTPSAVPPSPAPSPSTAAP